MAASTTGVTVSTSTDSPASGPTVAFNSRTRPAPVSSEPASSVDRNQPRNRSSKLRAGQSRFNLVYRALLLYASILACACIASALPIASGGSVASVIVDPSKGSDSDGCGTATPCKTIAYAIQRSIMSACSIRLTSGVFNESTVNINSITSLVISGEPSATIFDCSGRLHASGAVFNIFNSTVIITGVTFQNCFNPNDNGGAVSARASSMFVSNCNFINCSAASGGAISVAGPGESLFLNIQNSSFSRNSANGGLIGCPNAAAQPCSTWGGAIAAFEIFNVSISGCTMVSNNARAYVPLTSLQYGASKNALAGGGCVSILFFGNASHSSVHVSNNVFDQCLVDVSSGQNVIAGNGMSLLCFTYFGLFFIIKRVFTCPQDTAERFPCTQDYFPAYFDSRFHFSTF